MKTQIAMIIMENFNVSAKPVSSCGEKNFLQTIATFKKYFFHRDYKGDGVTCSDVNECLDEKICGAQSKCENTIGGYTCKCLAGFTHVNGECQDIDECSLDVSPCVKSSTKCQNLIGSYTCECLEGFLPEESIRNECQDVDECVKDDPCDSDADCFNSLGQGY